MVVSFGLWSLELTPGNEELVIAPADVRITNVSLGDVLVDPIGRSTVKITYSHLGDLNQGDEDESEDEDEDEKEVLSEKTTVLCSLTAGKFEHVTTDLVLEKDETFKFTTVGKNSVYLSGNYIDQEPLDNPPYGDSDMESDEGFGLGELAADVDMGSDQESDASLLEEVDEKSPATLKRGREPEIAVEDSKTGKKNKKLKGENGKAVLAETGKDEAKPDEKKDEKKKEGKKAKKEQKADVADEKNVKSAERELPGGLKIADATIGGGSVAKKGSFVSLRYIGKLQSGKVFDKNVKGSPFSFRLGKGEVIKGWEEGIVGMRVGGERKLTIPPAMAYGKKGTDGIPPNSTLIFEVKLVDVK